MRFMSLVLGGALLVACGQDPATAPPPEEPTEGELVEGTLGGDADLEGGCAWLEAADGRYDVMYPDGYTIAFDPVRVVGPDGEVVAEEGEVLRVRGHIDAEMMTVCQVGTVFRAEEVLNGE
ncbi:MAG TPA: hypothetical protein VM324_17145 [Egibacteraceae bacterium]|nr:hypothetical protein [Egibacteraceae bacterium]